MNHISVWAKGLGIAISSAIVIAGNSAMGAVSTNSQVKIPDNFADQQKISSTGKDTRIACIICYFNDNGVYVCEYFDWC